MASKATVNVPNYSNLLDNCMRKSIQEVGFKIVEEAQKTAPVDTGNYKNNIIFDGQKTVTAHANYSAAIEYGISKPVIIRPKTAKALRFTVGGKVVYAKFAQQKVRSPKPIMRNAARKVQSQVKSIVLRNFE